MASFVMPSKMVNSVRDDIKDAPLRVGSGQGADGNYDTIIPRECLSRNIRAIRTVLEKPGYILIEHGSIPGQLATIEDLGIFQGLNFKRPAIAALIETALGTEPARAIDENPSATVDWILWCFIDERRRRAARTIRRPWRIRPC